MAATGPLESKPRHWFEPEDRRGGAAVLAGDASRAGAATDHGPEDGLVSRLMPELKRLIAECHDQPVQHLRPAIRLLLQEQHFAFTWCSTVIDADPHRALDACVESAVRVLEHMRQQALDSGKWSDSPVTPQMFG